MVVNICGSTTTWSPTMVNLQLHAQSNQRFSATTNIERRHKIPLHNISFVAQNYDSISFLGASRYGKEYLSDTDMYVWSCLEDIPKLVFVILSLTRETNPLNGFYFSLPIGSNTVQLKMSFYITSTYIWTNLWYCIRYMWMNKGE